MSDCKPPGERPSYTWSILGGVLPPGLQLIALTGEITATPLQAVTYSFTIQVTDSSAPQNTTELIVGRPA
jgi:hypothetical protein